MSITAIIYTSLGYLYLGFGIYTFHFNGKSKPNKMFMGISTTLAFWSICLAFMSVTEDPQIASFYRWLVIIAWSSFYAEILDFSMHISDYKKLFKPAIYYTVLLTPAVLCFLIYITQPIPAEYLVRLNGAWAYVFPEGWGFIFDNFLTIYYVTYIAISIYVLYRYSKSAKYTRDRKAARIIYIALIIVAIISSIPEIILPSFGYTRIPSVTVVFSFIAYIGIWYSIRNLDMMTVSDNKLLAEVAEIMNEGIIILDDQDQVLSINNGAENLLGINNRSDISNDVIEKFFPKNFFSSESKIQSQECFVHNTRGREIPVMLSLNILKDKFNENIGKVLYFQDLTKIKETSDALLEEKNRLEEVVSQRTLSLKNTNEHLKNEIELRIFKEEEISKLAYTDHLTGLPNRRIFNEHLKREIEHTLRTKNPFALLFIDLDGFKMINDSLGHTFGDELLIRVAERLTKTLRKSDLIARLGGDEFAVLLFNPKDLQAVEYVCSQLLSELNQPFQLNKNKVHITASIGISMSPDDSTEASQLLQNADIAMYEAKEKGKGQFSFFDSTKKAGLQETMRLTNDLYSALFNDEMEIYYQPQICVQTKKIIGFEALLRWNHPDLGLIPPAKFIHIAERTGLINQIGKWVLTTASQQLNCWIEEYGDDLRMAINLSIKQLEKKNCSQEIIKAILCTGINPSLIDLEITESVLMKDVDHIISVLQDIKAAGLNISIDDFGTEYSSLGYIKHLPISQIKIPKTFIDGINDNHSDESIITSTIHLAKELGMHIVAEGVEDQNQYEYLLKNSCDIIQGYHFYEPMPALEVEKVLEIFEK